MVDLILLALYLSAIPAAVVLDRIRTRRASKRTAAGWFPHLRVDSDSDAS